MPENEFRVLEVYQKLRVKGWLPEGEDSNAGIVPGSEAGSVGRMSEAFFSCLFLMFRICTLASSKQLLSAFSC